MRYSKIVVILCVLVTCLFTAGVMMLELLGASVPDALIYCLFGMYGIELASCAGITITKVKRGADMPQIENGEANGRHARDAGSQAGE